MIEIYSANKKYGLKNDEDDNIICVPKYDEIRSFKEDLAAVRIGDKWGFIDKSGKEICEIRYDEVGDFNSKLSAVKKEGKMCYINTQGKEVKVTNFMGEEMEFSGCKSCAIGNHTITNLVGGYIYDDGLFNVTIDPEIPIKGFLVIGVNRHIKSTTQLSEKERIKLDDLTNIAKLALESLSIKDILLFEDGFSDHYRRWIIATYDWMFQFGRGKNLKQITLYAKNNTSMEEKKDILFFTEKLRDFFNKYRI